LQINAIFTSESDWCLRIAR